MIISCNDPKYRQCAVSVMDNIADPDIFFDEKGISNYYYEYKTAETAGTLKGKAATEMIKRLVAKMKEKGANKKYDCLIGVSGGIDSTFLAYKAHEYGLRALLVHFDNGWNSELAVKNIENVIAKCGFDLFTYVIDWEEFRDIQLSYFKAGVIDIEAITDIGILAALNKICSDFGIGFLLSGNNIWTEFTLPSSWINKNPNNLYNIHRKFGTIKLKNYPAKFNNGQFLHPDGSYEIISLLNYMDYNKRDTMEIITRELGWKDYGGKHYESVFTRFYQGYILPQKFKVDKRKAHLSNLIFSGQITKQDAICELQKPIYPNGLLEIDKQFVLKKLGLTEVSFGAYLNENPVQHEFYGGLNENKAKFSSRIRMKLGKIKQDILNMSLNQLPSEKGFEI